MSFIRRLGTTWSAVGGTALVAVATAVTAGLVLTGSSAPSGSPALTANPSGGTSSTGLIFTSAVSTFTISGTVYTTPSAGSYPAASCSGTPALLYPGVTRCEVFSVTNNLSVPISVQSITTTVTDSALPAQCTGSNLTLPGFTASAPTPAFVVNPGKTVSSVGEPIALNDSHTNQNACANLTYHFSFSGTASYTDTTSTGLKVSPAQSTYGQAVTFTATVTGANPNIDSYLPSGTVSFYSCSSATSCSPSPSTLLGTGTLSGGTATLTTSSLPLGNTYVEAVYPGSSTDYLGSTSGILTETVGYDSTITGNQGGGLTVGSGQAVEIASSGKVNGSATVQSGGILFLNGGTINGGLTVQSGGTFTSSGGTINGTVSITGAKTVSICSATVSGSVTVTNSTGAVVIGNPSSCGANTFKSGLTVTGNTGGVTISANNVTGTVTINNNTGPTSSPLQTVSANTISGGLACTGNSGLTDASQKNTVTGSRSGQCVGTF